jgi:plasmid maintenance system antidote protein VapI
MSATLPPPVSPATVGSISMESISIADPLSARAMAQVAVMPPHERLLLLAGCSLRELARRLGVVHTRLSAVFADATAYGRLSPEWSGRLAAAVDATPAEVDTLFGIRRGPDARRLA